jgi:hypothetical protein
MKGFSGFGNSPLRQDKLSKKTIKKYEEKGISKKELRKLNVTPSDTALTVTHPDLGESSAYLVDEARFSGGTINPDEKATIFKPAKGGGYKRTSKFKKY